MLLGSPKVAQRNHWQRAVLALGSFGNGAQLGHRDGRLGRERVPALGEATAALLHDPRRAQDERRLAAARLEREPELLGVGILSADSCSLLLSQRLDAIDLSADHVSRRSSSRRRNSGEPLRRARLHHCIGSLAFSDHLAFDTSRR